MTENKCSAETATVIANLMAKLPARLNRTVSEINKQTGINLYKYKNGDTFPLISTYLSFCLSLNLDPGFIFFLACEVQHETMTEARVIEIRACCPGHQPAASTAYQMILKDMLSKMEINRPV
jgi:hypothetical protein